MPAPASGRIAARLFLTILAVGGGAAALGTTLIRLHPGELRPDRWLPWPFLVGTLLLVAGSTVVHGARSAVRRERQGPFRRRMRAALVAGAAFVGFQAYGFRWLLAAPDATDAALGATPFVLVAGVLHAMHFAVVLLATVWVQVLAETDRYDHEYHFGVTVCAWCWHVLGAAWLVILGAMTVVRAV